MSSRSSSTLSTYYNQRPGILGRSDSYDPVKMIPGAYPEDRHMTPHPKQQTSHKLKDQVQGDVTTVKRELPTLSKTSPDILPSESFGDLKISDKPTTLPSALQDEYYSFAMAHSIDDDPLDLSEVVYADSFGMVTPEQGGEKRSLEVKDIEGDHESKGDRSTAVDRSYEERDVVVGHGGVTYNRFGRGGILPGYPTQMGMSKLIIDRMVDDQLRLAGVDDSTSSSVPAAISRSTNSSEGYPTNLPFARNIGIQDSRSGYVKESETRTVPCLDFSIIEEKRESLIFETDRLTSPRKFEVTPVTRSLSAESIKNDLAMRGFDSVSGSLRKERDGKPRIKDWSDRYRTIRSDFPT